jgi:hypothetical protein
MTAGSRELHRPNPASPRPSGTFDPVDLKAFYGLHEAIAEIAWIAARKGFQPPGSFDFHANVIAFAIEWEALYCSRIESSEWLEDSWIEYTERYALEKLDEVREHCMDK